MRRLPLFLPALAALVVFSCSTDMGPPGEWMPADEVQAPLTAELVTTPPPAMRERSISTDPLRVVTYNVETGEDPEALAAAIWDDPDLSKAGLLFVQEEESHPDEGTSRAQRLADALGMAYVYVPARMKGTATHGLAILSAFPITNVEKMELPKSDIPVTGAQRIAVRADIVIGGQTLHIVNVHLDTLLNVTDRIVQLRPAVIDAPDTVLVAGYFNTNKFVWAGGAVPVASLDSTGATDQAPVLDDYMRHLGFDTPTANLGATETMYGIDSRLDSIFSRGLDVTPGAVVRSIDLSDHWPMWVDVTLPAPGTP